MCSELTPRAPVPDNRIPQLMQPWPHNDSVPPSTNHCCCPILTQDNASSPRNAQLSQLDLVTERLLKHNIVAGAFSSSYIIFSLALSKVFLMKRIITKDVKEKTRAARGLEPRCLPSAPLPSTPSPPPATPATGTITSEWRQKGNGKNTNTYTLYNWA